MNKILKNNLTRYYNIHTGQYLKDMVKKIDLVEKLMDDGLSIDEVIAIFKSMKYESHTVNTLRILEHFKDKEYIPCNWCEKSTEWLGTDGLELCDSCLEKDYRAVCSYCNTRLVSHPDKCFTCMRGV